MERGGDFLLHHQSHSDCGKHQSPINIVYSQALFDEALPDIDVVHPEDGAHATSIVNNGHTRT